MKYKKIMIIILILIVVTMITLVAVVLGTKTRNTISSKEDKKITFKQSESSDIKVVDVNSNTRPYAVMINNIAPARAVQSGLSEAYVVYELLAEGGITRYLALFKDVELERIGSVRSSRHYYLDYVLENDAIYIHWGWSPQAKSDIKELKINNINGLTYEGTYFYRYNPYNISTEHTGFTSTELIKKAVEKLNYRDTSDAGLLLQYSHDAVNYGFDDETKAETINVTFSSYTNNKYIYNNDSKMYEKYVSGEQIYDFNTGSALKIKNLIVYSLEYNSIQNDSKGRQDLENIGTGEGYYFTEGHYTKIKWSKKDRSSKTIYTLENGEELKVNDGNTFIQIIPKSGSVVFS